MTFYENKIPSREYLEATCKELDDEAHALGYASHACSNMLRALFFAYKRGRLVKSLEWVEAGDGTHHDAHRQYEIEPDGDGFWRVVRGVTGGTSYLGHFRSIDAAKAAAQADYERRILEALE